MKIQKSTEIETELNNATKRLDELTEMRDGITANLETLQKGFIDGKTSLDDLQTEQGKLTILNESIKALEARQDELHSAFQKARLSESRAETLKQMKVIADETETAFNEYVSLRTQFNETIRQDGEKMVDALVLFHSKQREFAQSFRALAPGVTSFRPVPTEASESYGQVNSELKEIGLSVAKLIFVTSTYQNLPKIDFVEIVGIIERFIGNGRFNAEQKQRQEARKAAKV
jgi:chromosome segregation ATPase